MTQTSLLDNNPETPLKVTTFGGKGTLFGGQIVTKENSKNSEIKVFSAVPRKKEAYSAVKRRPLSQKPKNEDRLKIYATHSEVMKLIKFAGMWGQYEYRLRNQAIILLIYQHGLRCSELTNLLKRDIYLNTSDPFMKIRRKKGSLDGEHPIYTNEIEVIKTLIDQYPDSPYLFNTKKDIASKMSERRVHEIIKSVGEMAGFKDGNSMFPHKLRHATGFTLLNDKNQNLRTIQVLLGHVDYQNTIKYAEMGPEKLKGLFG